MFLSSNDTDARGFVERADQLVAGAVALAAPARVFVVQVEDWFDHKWLNFGGKIDRREARGGEQFVLPPFHSHRVVSERLFRRDGAGEAYTLEANPPALHATISSGGSTTQQRRQVADGALYAWYSSGSAESGRGAVIAFVPGNGTYWNWYLSLQLGTPWRVVRRRGISEPALRRLEAAGVAAPAA